MSAAALAGWLAGTTAPIAAQPAVALPASAPAPTAAAPASASSPLPPTVTLQAVPVTPAGPGAAPASSAGGQPDAAVATAPALRLHVFFNRVAAAGEPAAECDSVRALPRSVARTPAVAAAALRALFAGPSEAERAAGWRSPFSASTADLLRSVRLVQGTAYVDLQERPELLAAASSSCGAAELLVAIERTLRQFPSVRRVIVAIEGQPRRFYDAIGLRCDASNDQCDPRPFQAATVRH